MQRAATLLWVLGVSESQAKHFCILYFIPSAIPSGVLRRPLEHPVQPLSLTERETEVQKEGGSGPLSHGRRMLEGKKEARWPD